MITYGHDISDFVRLIYVIKNLVAYMHVCYDYVAIYSVLKLLCIDETVFCS
jgi:hypothetical protein